MTKTFVRAALCGLLGLLVAVPASAGGRHHHPRASFGFHFGGPFYDPFYDPWPYYRPMPPVYYEPRTVIIERDPPVYIQRQPAPAPAPTQATVWYYCPSPAGYYPHVPTCTQQWVPVDPATLPPR